MNLHRTIKDSTPALSPEERALREEAVAFARGSVRFEGFTLSAQAEALNRRFVAGEIGIDEHIAGIQALR